jgi:TonB family protein
MRIVCACALLGASNLGNAQAADSGTGTQSAPFELKAVVQKMIQSSWDLESYRGWWLRDVRGKTPADDLRTFVLTDSDLKILRTLTTDLERISQADQDGFRAATQQVNEVLTREFANAALVYAYWGNFASNAYHRQLIEGLWQQLDPFDAAAAKSALDAAEKPLLAQAAAIMNGANPNLHAVNDASLAQLRKVQLQLSGLYGEERTRAAKQASAANRERGLAPRGRDRRAACTPAQETSHKPQPKLVQPLPKPEYSTYARRVGLAVPVTLHLWISELGCIDRVEVAQSSGAPELDDSALNWAERDIAVLPAEVDGKAVASDRSFTITFDLKE